MSGTAPSDEANAKLTQSGLTKEDYQKHGELVCSVIVLLHALAGGRHEPLVIVARRRKIDRC